jgi:hypothetical protein
MSLAVYLSAEEKFLKNRGPDGYPDEAKRNKSAA